MTFLKFRESTLAKSFKRSRRIQKTSNAKSAMAALSTLHWVKRHARTIKALKEATGGEFTEREEDN